MGRGYWLPPQSENLPACDGFYIDSQAAYDDSSGDWEIFLDKLCNKIQLGERTLEKRCCWKPCTVGQSRFVVLQNHHVDIVVEDVDDYIAVYALIPEDCAMPDFAKKSFPRYINILHHTLTEMYPGKIRKRINSQHTKMVG